MTGGRGFKRFRDFNMVLPRKHLKLSALLKISATCCNSAHWCLLSRPSLRVAEDRTRNPISLKWLILKTLNSAIVTIAQPVLDGVGWASYPAEVLYPPAHPIEKIGAVIYWADVS